MKSSRKIRLHLGSIMAAGAALVVFSGCAIGLGKSVHQYALTEMVPTTGKEKARPIEVEANQFVVLGFVYDTDFVDEARSKLLAQCQGRIVGVTAKHSTDLGVAAYRNKLKLTATCLE